MPPADTHNRRKSHQQFAALECIHVHQQQRRQMQQGCAVRHSSGCRAKQRSLLWRQQQQMVTPIWLTLLLLVHALVPCIHAVSVHNMQQSQQIVKQQHHDSAGHTAADADADHLSASAAFPAAAAAPWNTLRGQARQRRQQFKQHVYQQQQLLPPRAGQQQHQDEEHALQLPLTLQSGSFGMTNNNNKLRSTVGARITSTRRNTDSDSTAATDTVQRSVLPSASHSNTADGPSTDTTVFSHSAAVANAVPGTILPSTSSYLANGDTIYTSSYIPNGQTVVTTALSDLSDGAAAAAVTATAGPDQAATAAAVVLDHDIAAAAAAVDNAGVDQVDMMPTAAMRVQETNLQHPAAGMPRHQQQQQQQLQQQLQQQQDQQQSSSTAAVQRLNTRRWSMMTAATAAAGSGLPTFDLYRWDSHDVADRMVQLISSSTRNMQGSRSSYSTTADSLLPVPAATTAAAAAAGGTMGRGLSEAEAATNPEQQQQQPLRPSAFDGGVPSIPAAAAEQLPGPALPPTLVADPNVPVKAAAVPAAAAAAAATPAADLPLDSLAHPHAGTAAAAGSTALTASDASTAIETATTAAAAPAAAHPATGSVSSNVNAAAGVPTAAAAGAVEVGGSSHSSSSSSSSGAAASSSWKPQVLDAPVPKWPRLYSTVAPPAPTLAAAARSAAVQALLSAAAAAHTPQGISISGIPGLSLEDKILLARLLGHVVNGTFDDLAQMDPANTAYWEQLDAQVEKHTQVKHMFESIWYKCSKLNADLLMRASTAYDMEIEALHHILAWLGVPERHLPRPGEFANFDDLVALLNGIGAQARLVTDPVPFLATTRPPLDRNGMPMLIHMTFKDKGQFARHHLLSLASWSKENPDHAILMYDDADLEAYLRTYDPSVLELYGSLKTAVERSDLWRYVVMCKHGGVYTDADTLCVRPIQEWNSENHNDAEALFGVEDVFKRDPNRGNSGWGVSMGRFGIQFEQWTLAGAANHPVYCNMHSFISQRMKDEASKLSPVATTDSENWSILHRTGPHVWTDSVLKWMHDQGIGFHEALVPGGRLVSNNTRIMPGETFGCAAHFFSPAARLEEVYAMHMFRGVWRKRLDSGGAEAARRDLRLGF